MIQLFRAFIVMGLLFVLVSVHAEDAKKKYHILYSGQSEAAYGPCG